MVATVRCQATCGDLVEFDYGPFQHWGVYVGGDKVVHLTVPERQESSRWSQVFPSSGYVVCDRSQVRLQPVWQVKHLATLLRYGVSHCFQIRFGMSGSATDKLRRVCGEKRK